MHNMAASLFSSFQTKLHGGKKEQIMVAFIHTLSGVSEWLK